MRIAVAIVASCVAGLLTLGMVMLYSCSMAKPGAQYVLMQLVWGGIGVVACACATAFDYRRLRLLAWPLYLLTVVLLLLVWAPEVGLRVKGASRWVRLGPVTMQPSEVAKLALIVWLAWYGERYQRQMSGWKRGIVVPGIFIGLLLGLIFIEPDRGTTILLAAVSGTVLLIAGVRWVCFLPPLVLGVGGLAFSLWHDPMRIKRIFGWLYLEEHKTGVGYQAYQAMLALGAGGWTGLGLGNGRQKHGFIPEQHTDFILSVIGEELGLVATLLIVAAFVAIVISGVSIASKARDAFGLLLGAGISFLIGLQAFINVGVVTSALPNKGLPLPFISYGGSNLVVMLTCVGLLFSIARHARSSDLALEQEARDDDEFTSKNPFKAKPQTSNAHA